ncbi:unnamed protein product [Tuber aestivum]|uniref:Uncharacterized protein n=1 Tax=Tuber aestivum TaxID=59557 RepID=A0A292PTE8_9PEZI|nr:unnamed protein product [Tuber aestivum]
MCRKGHREANASPIPTLKLLPQSQAALFQNDYILTHPSLRHLLLLPPPHTHTHHALQFIIHFHRFHEKRLLCAMHSCSAPRATKTPRRRRRLPPRYSTSPLTSSATSSSSTSTAASSLKSLKSFFSSSSSGSSGSQRKHLLHKISSPFELAAGNIRKGRGRTMSRRVGIGIVGAGVGDGLLGRHKKPSTLDFRCIGEELVRVSTIRLNMFAHIGGFEDAPKIPWEIPQINDWDSNWFAHIC